MVTKTHKTVIEINGRRYDASTGKLLKPSQSLASADTPHNSVHHLESHPAHPVSVHEVTPKPRPAHSPAKVINHPNAKIQKSHTLMRHAVRKPVPGKKLHHIAPRIHHPTAQVLDVVGNKPAPLAPLNKSRLRRAEGVKRSRFVTKFLGNGHKYEPRVIKQTTELAVVPTPIYTDQRPPSPQPQPEVSHQAHNISISARASRQLEEQALMNANTHEYSSPAPGRQKLHHRAAKKLGVKPSLISVAAGSLATVLIAGFIAYQNVPNFAVRVAASKSGVSAKMPGYKPSGFGYTGPVKYSPGQVTIVFNSNSDDRSFALTQKTSNWNSDSLLTNYVATAGANYQTFQDKGRTIYVVDNRATWVNGGIWYEIAGNSRLNSDQLVRIATSL